MREILLRIASTEEPIRADTLWRRASREANRMTPFAIAAMWELVDEGLLDYDSSSVVTVVSQRGGAPKHDVETCGCDSCEEARAFDEPDAA